MAWLRGVRLDKGYHDPAMDEREWITGTQRGDHQAFDAMFTAYADPLSAYAHGLLRSASDAQELVQDLFLWIWQHRERWEVPGQLRTYLYRSVHNRAISLIRHRRVEHVFRLRSEAGHYDSLDLPTSTQPEAHVRLEEADLRRRVDRALASLPERARQAFLLCRQHYMTYAEVSQVMGVTEKTVENHMARALAGLRAELEDLTTRD